MASAWRNAQLILRSGHAARQRTSTQGTSGAAAAPALQQTSVERQLASATNPDDYCLRLAKLFGISTDEVALLRLENGLLKFLFPQQLTSAGTIPISSSTAVAAHTAVTKKVELFNNFTRIKHASIFETIKPSAEKEQDESRPATIHKLMTAPVLDNSDKVLGVIQISHKGFDLASSGPDFTLDDLQRLELAAKVLAGIGFMRDESLTPFSSFRNLLNITPGIELASGAGQ